MDHFSLVHRCGTAADRRNYAIPKGLLELMHGGLKLELKWQSYDTVGRSSYGVVFSLTQLDLVDLVVSSLTN